jgi:hypothetical protein
MKVNSTGTGTKSRPRLVKPNMAISPDSEELEVYSARISQCALKSFRLTGQVAGIAVEDFEGVWCDTYFIKESGPQNVPEGGGVRGGNPDILVQHE